MGNDRDDYRGPRNSGYRGEHGPNYNADRGQGYGRSGGQSDYRGNDDRGFIDRAGDEVRSWFGDEDAEHRRERDARDYDRESYRDQGRGNDRGGFAGAVGGAMSSARSAMSQNDRHPDPNYHSWRQQQIEALDRDYDDYRKETQSKFDNDFGSWRTTRQGQRSSLSRVTEHMEVVGSDGQHIGTVDKVKGDRIILTKTDTDAGGHHHSIPCSWIETIDDKVKVSKTADQAQQAWRDEDRGAMFGNEQQSSDGPHMLNRSFSGTY